MPKYGCHTVRWLLSEADIKSHEGVFRVNRCLIGPMQRATGKFSEFLTEKTSLLISTTTWQ
jgi:hypothetical protein